MELIASARSVRVSRGGASEERVIGGAGLARALDAGGAAALTALLSDGADAVELEDAEVAVRIERDAGGARVRTRWASGESLEQVLPLATRGRPMDDVVAALHDPTRVLRWHQGRWWEGEGPADLVVPALAPETLGSPAF
ncbi:MAG: hypothetical protein ACK4YP_04295, partial [Myxococcota bacterium]